MNTYHPAHTLLHAVCVMAAVLGLTRLAHAEDIDIFNGAPAGLSSNLVVVFDNAAASDAKVTFNCDALAVKNPDRVFGFEVCGLYGALTGLEKMITETVPKLPLNLGLMYTSRDKSKNGGEFVLPAPKNGLNPGDLLPLNKVNIQSFKNRVAELSLEHDKNSSNKFSQTLQEGFAFYNGLTGLSGAQYGDLSPIDDCGANYIVYLTLAINNMTPGGANVGRSALEAITGKPFVEDEMGKYTSPYPGGKDAKWQWKNDPSDEWATFMLNPTVGNKQYKPVKTYTIILYDGSNPDYEQLMDSVSRRGGSTPVFVKLGDTKGLSAAFEGIARKVMAVNSAFVAPVLPVSTNTQGSYANQVYIGMFRPETSGKPRWQGNLKQYKVGLDKTDPNNPRVFLADSTGKGALSDAGTGFMDPSAISYWTSKDTTKLPDSAGGFWKNTSDVEEGVDSFDRPDGHRVEKGGAAQQLRLSGLTDLSKRNVYSCPSSGCTEGADPLPLSTTKFTTGNAVFSEVAADATLRDNIIRWARGEYMAGAGVEATPPVDSSIKVRGSVHGDVLHSRPAVLNYANHGTVVFYGTNDGHFRAINGNQTSTIASKDAADNNINVNPGGELWSFIAPEFHNRLKRLYDDAPALSLGQSCVDAADCQPKTYFFDGSPGVYQDGSRALLFLSARRGGRMLYALDVSDPINPKFLWKIKGGAVDLVKGDFTELGQTWSQPQVARVKGHADPVLIFGGGYDTHQDTEPPGTDTMGRGIFIVDAFTGKLLWRAGQGGGSTSCKANPCLLSGMTHSIPADIALINRFADGDATPKIDRLYAADTGGNIWRVDLEPDGTGAISTWQAYQIASLGGTGDTKRKFFFPPDVAVTKSVDIVAAVSGDREHPLYNNQATQVQNRFYMIKDTRVGRDGRSDGDWTVVNDSDLKDATDEKYTPSLTDPYKGFRVDFANAGEKGVNAPSIIGPVVMFGTNQPPQGSSICKGSLGNARGYQINILTGEKTSTLFDNGGMPPSPLLVNIEEIGRVCFGCGSISKNPTPADSKSSSGAGFLDPRNSKDLRRTYWIRKQDK